MKIFANPKIKVLLIRILLCILIAAVLSATAVSLRPEKAVWVILICSVLMGIGILLVCYRYLQEQNSLMEDAVSKVRSFISGDGSARIECDEEGELYRLFHEINSLAAILNAKAENEGRSKRFLQSILSDISHQLKTPIAALNIYNGIIQTEAGERGLPEIREFSDLSEQELERMENLVQNLLKITKFNAGSIVMEKNQENISEMMEDVKRQFSFRAGCEGKKIVLEGSESLSFLCDRNWMVEAVSNIVKNALDHTEDGDSVRIEWGQYAASIRITIRDNGSGIHPEDLHHIFKRFYRSRYSKDTQGAGLGLPLAKAVVEAHNGTIETDSQLGVGTAFVISCLITTKL